MNIAVLYPADDVPDGQYDADDSEGRDDTSYITETADALKRLGHKVMMVPMDFKAYDILKDAEVDIAFNMCDTGFMNITQWEPHVSSLLEMLRIPYTGSDSMTIATCLEKNRAKKIMAYYGIPTAKFQTFISVRDRLSKELSFPLFVKPNQEDASIGIKLDCLVRNDSQLRKKVREIIMHYHQPALVEEYIDGREVHSMVVGHDDKLLVLPLVEIDFKQLPSGIPHVFTYEAKWDTESEIYKKTPQVCPAPIPAEMAGKIVALARKTYQVLGLHDYGRVDFRIDSKGDIFVLEVNPNPDISPTDYITMMLNESKMKYDEFIDRILQSALERSRQQGITARNIVPRD